MSREYSLPESGTITASKLRRAKKEIQVEVMRAWFLQHYTDPVENTPYESAEGGYQYIWGGPYDPREELESEFGSVVRDSAIEELADELRTITFEWTGNPDEQEQNWDDLLLDVSSLFGEHVGEFHDSMQRVEGLLSTNVTASLRQTFDRLLYANVITALEVFLSGFFVSKVNSDQQLFRRLLEQDTDFAQIQLRLNDVYNDQKIKKVVNDHLAGMMWHNLAKVNQLFKIVLGVELGKPGEVYKAVVLRHDIVHRNGKKRDGTQINVGDAEVRSIVNAATSLVHHIDEQWNAMQQAPNQLLPSNIEP